MYWYVFFVSVYELYKQYNPCIEFEDSKIRTGPAPVPCFTNQDTPADCCSLKELQRQMRVVSPRRKGTRNLEHINQYSVRNSTQMCRGWLKTLWMEYKATDVRSGRRRLGAAAMKLPCSFWFVLLFGAGGLVLFIHLQEISEMVQQQVPEQTTEASAGYSKPGTASLMLLRKISPHVSVLCEKARSGTSSGNFAAARLLTARGYSRASGVSRVISCRVPLGSE
ncbi:hypothetical protein SKAU_G00103880 [Synaphobranchus kaupii]|uniref:Uncharacterized protein n=1 Tax=Synaphobranchus kaupii TaxID=118154 RepID=A0A9Q1FZZ8_SYNKA|nr:hypothetical protein SKAU_G00103880 [Synaphobranchus kaupii]